MNGFLYQLVYKATSLFLKKRDVVFASNFDRDIYLNLDELYSSCKKASIPVKIIYSNKRNWVEAFKTIFVFAKAKVLIVDCSHWVLSKIFIDSSTKVIYVGHGGGCYKKMGFAARHVAQRTQEKTRKLYGQFSYVISTSPEFDSYVCSNYGVAHDQLLKIGLARTDLLYYSHETFRTTGKNKGKILLFAPSYVSGKTGRKYRINYEHLATIAQKTGWTVWYSAHPDVEDKKRIPLDWIDCSSKPYQEKVLIPTVLVTDRSSLMFDFCITGKPIIVYDNDFLDHKNLWIKPEDLRGVNLCHTEDELSLLLQNPEVLSSSKLLFEQQMSRCNGHSCSDFVSFIKGI